MKQTTTILFLLVAIYSFGQDTVRVGEMTMIQTSVKTSLDDKTAPKHNTGYVVVEPKQSEWKMVIPSNEKMLVGRQADSVAYKFSRVEQAEWTDTSSNAFVHEINVARHSLATTRLTYDQVKYLTDLPYLK